MRILAVERQFSDQLIDEPPRGNPKIVGRFCITLRCISLAVAYHLDPGRIVFETDDMTLDGDRPRQHARMQDPPGPSGAGIEP